MVNSGQDSSLQIDRPPDQARYWILWAIALLALALRLAPLLRPGADWAMANVDSARYVELADGMRAGCGFARLLNGHCGPPEVFRTPGYPLLLAAITSLRLVVALQAIIGAALCLGVGYFVHRLWDLRSAVVAEVLLATDLPSIMQSSRILSDTLFQGLLTCAVILEIAVIARGLWDRRALATVVAASALLAFAILVRPVGLLLPIIAPLALIFLPAIDWRTRSAAMLLVFAIPALATAGWAARNARRTGVWTFSTIAAVNLYYFRAGGVVWYRGHQDFSAVMDALARRLGYPNANDYPDTPASLAPRMTSDAIHILLNDPAGTVSMTARSFFWLAVVPDRGGLNELLGTNAGATSYLAATGEIGARLKQLVHSPLLTVLVLLQLILTAFTWIGAALAVIRLRGRPRREIAVVLIPLGVALVMILLASGAEAYARYRMPAIPLLAIVAGVGWSGASLQIGGNSAALRARLSISNG